MFTESITQREQSTSPREPSSSRTSWPLEHMATHPVFPHSAPSSYRYSQAYET